MFVMGAGRHMAAVGFARCGGSAAGRTRLIASAAGRRTKRPSPSAPSSLGPDVTARRVLTLSEATDLIEAQCWR